MAAIRIVALLGLIALVASQDDVPVQGPNGLKVHCSRKGARISVYRDTANGTSTGKITISFEELSELDGSGNPVSGQSGGKGKHVYSAFDKLVFAVNGPVDVVLPYSNQVNASCLTVTANLQEVAGATFAGQVCAIKDNGMLYLGEENSTVSAGQLKFTVNVRNWIWAEAGAFLQLKINIKIPPGHIVREDSESGSGKKLPKKFLFGGGAAANFSTQVKVDNEWKAMPAGYPKLENHGANNYITIRIPRFNTSGEYDPSVDPGNQVTSSSNGPVTLLSSIPLGIISFLIASLMRL